MAEGCGNAGGVDGANQAGNATGGSAQSGSGGNDASSTTGGANASNVGGNASTTGGAANATTGGSSTTSSSGGSGTGGSSTTSTTKFSFFVTSQARLFAMAQAFNGSTKGWGGDFRYGETGTGAGLRGADKICTEIAEASMPGNGKTWRAFLSATNDGTGAQVNAINRIGSGPWYDRLGRLFGNSVSELLSTRPSAANATIINDFPNEDGVLNHDALQTGNTANQDNHDILTGTNAQGTLYGASATCSDWTSSTGSSSQKPRCGHSWPRGNSGSMANWMSALDEAGCAAGANLAENNPNGQPTTPGSDGTLTVGSGGGYGGIYCFALSP